MRDKVPAEVFTTPYRNPVGGTAEAQRANLRRAFELLREACYEQRGGQLISTRTGEPLRLELLGFDPSFERYALRRSNSANAANMVSTSSLEGSWWQ